MSEQASNLTDVDETAEKARAAQIRFKQQVFGTVGSAMLFGLVGVATTLLLKGGGSVLMTALGMGSVAVIGLGCIYLAAKFISTSVAMDQDAQARKIALAKAKAKAVEIEQPATEVTVSRPMGTPFGVVHTHDEAAREIQPAPENRRTAAPSHMISHVAHHEKMHAPAHDMLTSHAAPESSWASRAAANDTTPAHPEQAGRA